MAGVQMSKVKVTIKLFMDIPKNWSLVKHSDDKILMDIGDGKFLDMGFTPMIATKSNNDAELTTDYDETFAKSILGMVTECKVRMQKV
jgi:hypothetical protein